MSEKENILGTLPVGRLVLTMSWPIMLSMLMQAVYNLVDSIFVAQLSDVAFLALSYAYPIQTLMIAFCVGTGVGFSAILSGRLGEGRKDEANDVVFHGLTLYALCWVLFCAFGLLGSGAYLRACTDTAEAAALGAAYLRVCCCFSFGVCLQFPCERILQSTGHPAGFMLIQGSGAVINLILDPILIFGLNMGVVGAAVATVIGQISGSLLGLLLVRRLRSQFHVTPKGVRLSRRIFREIGRIALPSILMQSLSSVMTLGLNAILTLWSETAVWVLGVYFKLQSFVFMPIFSVNNGLVSILSFNYGAGRRDRVARAVTFGLQVALITAALGLALLWVGALPLLAVCFHAGAEAIALGVPALRMTGVAFLPAAVSIVYSAAYQSLGYSRYSLLISLLRYIVLLLPLTWLLVRLCTQWAFGGFALTEAATGLLAAGLYRKVRREKLRA